MFKRITSVYQHEKGFTLIELAIVIVIVGVMFGFVIKVYDQWAETKKSLITQQRIEDIERAIIEYIGAQGMLPCPSSLVAPFGSANFGRALPLPPTPGTFPVTCTPGVPDPGTYEYPGRLLPTPVNVRIGAVPTRKFRDADLLYITDDHAFDGWGRRFTFAVTTEMANTTTGYSDNDGGITVLDPAGNSLTAFEPQTGMYTIISHGPDGLGAHNYNGGLWAACAAGSIDTDNCDYLGLGNSQFTHTLVSSRAGGAANMDDYVAFATKDLTYNAKIAAFIVEKMACTPQPGYFPGNHPAFPSIGHPAHPNCATDIFTGSQSFVDRGLGETPASNGRLLHSTTFNAVTTGSVYVRATIPVRIWPVRWDAPLLVSVYIGESVVGPFLEYKAGELIDPTNDIGLSHGGTGVVLAQANITQGKTYDVQIYAYHLCAGGSPTCWAGGALAHTGTIDLIDHIVEGIVEISQSGS